MEDPETDALTETGGDGAMQQPSADPLTTISVQQLTDRVQKIRRARQHVMDEDVHYGTIPGTGDKPTLLKPGAEILCNLFQLAPDPELEIRELGGDHREYIVRGGLRHMPTGNQVGSGYGSCSTKESKYRYRYIENATDVPVPNAFWRSADEMSDRDFSILLDALESEGVPVPADAEAGVTKEQGQWLITLEGKGENPDLADVYNTCLKMAKKRWLVDVSLTATGASEIFTQYLDDMEDLRGTDVGGRQVQTDTSATGAQDTSQQRQELVGAYDHHLTKQQAQKLQKRDDALMEREGEELAAAIASVEDEMEGWPSDRLVSACDTMLETHRERLQDHEAEAQHGERDVPDEEAGTEPEAESLGEELPDDFPAVRHLREAGLTTLQHVDDLSDEDLQEIDGIGETYATQIRDRLEAIKVGDIDPNSELPF